MRKLSTFRITKRTVDALVADRDAIYFDADLRGFGVRTKPSGSKTYLVQYEANGRTRRVTIGAHGVLTPSEARQKATVLLGKTKNGEDPAQDRLIARKAMTVAQLCELYLIATEKKLILGKKGLPKKSSTLATDRGRILRHILPLLGTRKVRDLSTPDIVRFMRDVASGKTAADIRTKARGRAVVTGGNGTAARTVGLLGGILSYAVSEGIIPASPAHGVKRPADGRRVVRLSIDQYAVLGEALRRAEAEGESWKAIAAVRLLALTGCRRGEIEKLSWSDVDFTGRCLRFSDTKTGSSVRPLGDAVLRLLNDLPRTNSQFVLPSAKTRVQHRPFTGLPKAWKRILSLTTTTPVGASEQTALDGLTLHGLRHAFASTAHDLGYSEPTIAALLGHRAATVTGRYIHHVDAALQAAADKVAERVSAAINRNAMSAKTGNVVRLADQGTLIRETHV
jgi:integrase